MEVTSSCTVFTHVSTFCTYARGRPTFCSYEPEKAQILFLKKFWVFCSIISPAAKLLMVFSMNYTMERASDCFYRGGMYNWIEGGRKSQLVTSKAKLQIPRVGEECTDEGRYCASSPELDFWYPCNRKSRSTGNLTRYEGCYFGRGPLQATCFFSSVYRAIMRNRET